MEVLVNLSLNLQSPRFSTVGNRASLQPTSHWLISARPLVYKSSLLVSTSSMCLRDSRSWMPPKTTTPTPWTQSDYT